MFCSNCGNPLDPNTGVCTACGLQHAVPQQASAPQVPLTPQQPVYSHPSVSQITEDNIPEKYSPLKAWTYFWLKVLFGVPIVGLIFLIIFTFNDSNINRRNFARSQWCALIILAIVIAIFAVIFAVSGASLFALFNYFN